MNNNNNNQVKIFKDSEPEIKDLSSDEDSVFTGIYRKNSSVRQKPNKFIPLPPLEEMSSSIESNQSPIRRGPHEIPEVNNDNRYEILSQSQEILNLKSERCALWNHITTIEQEKNFVYDDIKNLVEMVDNFMTLFPDTDSSSSLGNLSAFLNNDNLANDSYYDNYDDNNCAEWFPLPESYASHYSTIDYSEPWDSCN